MPQMNNQYASEELDQGKQQAEQKGAQAGQKAYTQGEKLVDYVKNNKGTDRMKSTNGSGSAAGEATKETAEEVSKREAAKEAAKEGAKAAAKEGAKEAAKGGIKEALSSLVAGGLGVETLAVIAVVILLICIPLIFLSLFPIGNLFQTSTELETAENKLYKAVEKSYITERNSAKKQILKYVNENYSCKAGASDLSVDGGTFTIDTDTCYITATISPGLSAMKQNISAYVNAVNGTIAYFGEDTNAEIEAYENGTHEKIEKFDGKIFQTNSDGSVTMTDEAKQFYNEHSNEITNASNEDYINDLGVKSKDFFVYDEETTRWDFYNFHIGPKTHQEWQCVGYEDILDEDGNVIGQEAIYDWVDVTVDAWYGDIGILMYYDLSSYKADELQQCVEILESKNSNIDAYQDATSVVSAVLHEYYNSYIGQFNGYYDTSGKYQLGQDNRERIFQKLLNDGTLMYVPISGLTSNFLEGSPGYSGELGFSDWDGMSSKDIWKEINRLRSAGIIGYRTSAWNCTAFAQAWLYKVYGDEAANAIYSNGKEMVNVLLSTNNEKVGDWGAKHFYRGSSPAPGGIFSISSVNGGNHVGCVDAVDYEAKTITFSDGNTNGAANSTSTISIKRTLTFEQFQTYVNGCCHGSVGCVIQYANPNKKIDNTND